MKGGWMFRSFDGFLAWQQLLCLIGFVGVFFAVASHFLVEENVGVHFFHVFLFYVSYICVEVRVKQLLAG